MNINNKNIICVRCTPVEGKSDQEEYSFKRYRTTYSEGKFVKGWIMFVNGVVR